MAKTSNMVKPDVKETGKYNPPPRKGQQTFGNKNIAL